MLDWCDRHEGNGHPNLGWKRAKISGRESGNRYKSYDFSSHSTMREDSCPQHHSLVLLSNNMTDSRQECKCFVND